MDTEFPLRAMRLLEVAVEHVTRGGIPDGPEGVDILARLHAVIGKLDDLYRSSLVEMPAGIVGHSSTYRTVEKGGKNEYSFNRDAILRDIQVALEDQSGMPCTFPQALKYAVDEGAAKVTFTQSKVEKMFRTLGVAMTVAPHEAVDDIESPVHVGKVWKAGKTAIEAIESKG